MVKFTLFIHLVGAAVLAVILFRALFTVHYVRYAKAIGINTAAQFASGSLLAVVGSGIRVGQFCLSISIYLLLILSVEAILFWKISQTHLASPVEL